MADHNDGRCKQPHEIEIILVHRGEKSREVRHILPYRSPFLVGTSIGQVSTYRAIQCSSGNLHDVRVTYRRSIPVRFFGRPPVKSAISFHLSKDIPTSIYRAAVRSNIAPRFTWTPHVAHQMKHDAKRVKQGPRSRMCDRAGRHFAMRAVNMSNRVPLFRFASPAPPASTLRRRHGRPTRAVMARSSGNRRMPLALSPMTLTSVKFRRVRTSRPAVSVCTRCRSGMLGRVIYRPDRFSALRGSP
ncbi:hypothetical protein BTHA_3271 [Burkholderia thailandensis MSMB59]|nr:hypothetical protein BTHA_3271 [Burkholderia thailandensis MSMB59]